MAIALILVVLVVQMAVTMVGAVWSDRELSNAQRDTMGYVGELTASEVGHFAAEAIGVVNSSVAQYETALPGENVTVESAARAAYLRMRDNSAVRALYIGIPDGGYFYLERDGDGYRQVARPGIDEPSSVAILDDQGVIIETSEIDSGYDPRSRPWYQVALGSGVARWTDPFVAFGAEPRTLVTVARAARSDSGELLAVIGADVSTELLTGVLDDLPYGADAEAFVLAGGQEVVAAPTAYDAMIGDYIVSTGNVPTASDLGVELNKMVWADGETYETASNTGVQLTREVDSNRAPWWIHLSAPVSALSGGLGALKSIAWWSSALTLVVTAIALAIIWTVRHPLARLQRAATTDALTGIANRDAFMRRGARLLRRAGDQGDCILLAAIDLDNFKSVNDRLGHGAGDEVLTHVARAMSRTTREGDVVARLGGDEFAVVMAIRPDEDARLIAERLRDEIENTVRAHAAGGSEIGVTMGIVHSTEGEHELASLLVYADNALVQGKQVGKGRVYVAVPFEGQSRVASPA